MAETQEVEKPVATVEDKAPDAPAAGAPVTFDSLFGNEKEVAHGLGEIKRKEIGENERIMKQSEGQAAQDRSVAQRHYQAAGVEAEKMAPWNAKQEYEKVQTSPLEAFGSFASVFAIVASAFTHAPLENALNASAAAMSAIKKGDDEAYERGHSAWKENMDLVQKRFNMQNTLYKDALDLMTHDQNSGRIALQNAALRFGDQKTLFLLENGLDKDVIDLNTARIRQMDAMTKAADGMTESKFRQQAFDSLKNDYEQRNGKPPDANETMTMWNFAHGVKEPWQQQLMQQFLMKHQGEPDLVEKAGKFAQTMLASSRAGAGGVESQLLAKFRQEYTLEHGEAPSTAEETEFLRNANAARRKEDVKTEAIKEIQKKNEANGVPITLAEAERQWKVQTKLPNFTLPEQRRVASVPTLMTHLAALDWLTDNQQLLKNDPTGIVKYLPQHLAAVYGGINDAQQLYESALRGAKSSTADLGSGGNTLKTALNARLERLPGNFADSRFNKRLVQSFMQDTASESRTMLSLLERQGKALPPDVLSEYTKWGIYPGSMANVDPVQRLRTAPQDLSDREVMDVRRYAPTLPPADQQLLRKEIMRRKALEQSQGAPQ